MTRWKRITGFHAPGFGSVSASRTTLPRGWDISPAGGSLEWMPKRLDSYSEAAALTPF